jgi:hypothetical protein
VRRFRHRGHENNIDRPQRSCKISQTLSARPALYSEDIYL